MPVQGLIWVGLYVNDLALALPFYRDVLGLPLTSQDGRSAQFTLPGGMTFELLAGGVANQFPKGVREQSIQVALRVDDWEATMTVLRHHGVILVGDVTEWDGLRWVCVVDPEGNKIQLAGVVRD